MFPGALCRRGRGGVPSHGQACTAALKFLGVPHSRGADQAATACSSTAAVPCQSCLYRQGKQAAGSGRPVGTAHSDNCEGRVSSSQYGAWVAAHSPPALPNLLFSRELMFASVCPRKLHFLNHIYPGDRPGQLGAAAEPHSHSKKPPRTTGVQVSDPLPKPMGRVKWRGTTVEAWSEQAG